MNTRCQPFPALGLALLGLGIAALLGGTAWAQAPAPPAVTVQLSEQKLEPLPPITLVRVRAGDSRMVFAAPPGFRYRNHEARSEVRFISADDSCSVSLVVRPADAAPATSANPDEAMAELAARWQAGLLARYPNAKILETWTETADGRVGPACQLHWPNTGSGELKLRATLLRFGAHWVELTLTSAPAALEQNRPAFNDILLTLRHAEGQDPPAPEFSNKI